MGIAFMKKPRDLYGLGLGYFGLDSKGFEKASKAILACCIGNIEICKS